MSLMEIVNKRRSVREFKPEPVPREIVEEILDIARRAPSAGNVQPWFFYVVTGRKEKDALAAAALGQKHVAQAPVCIVVCAEPELSAREYGERGRNLYSLQDTAIATTYIHLAVAERGLGSCWVGAFDEHKVSDCLNIPDYRRPVAMIPIGYPSQEKDARTRRKELAEITKFL